MMLARSVAVGALVLASCYTVPTPVCGFACASQNTVCPDGYTCNSTDNRCHLDGDMTTTCKSVADDPNNDFFPPVLQDSGPRTNVEPPTPDIYIQFDEKVLHVSQTSFFLTDSAQQLVASSVTNSNPTRWGLGTAALTFGATYTVHVTNAITDEAGNQFAGETYSFMVAPDVPPHIDFAGIFPSANDTDVAVNTNILVAMSEPVITLSGKAHLVEQGSGIELPTTIDNTGVTDRAFLDPQDQLRAHFSYRVRLDPDVTDTTGNFITQALSWEFSTGDDNVPPALRETMPKANSVAPVDTTISFLFDESVTSIGSVTVSSSTTTFTGTLASTSGGHLWQFTPDAAFPPNTIINVSLTNASDASSNLRNFVFSFTTAP